MKCEGILRSVSSRLDCLGGSCDFGLRNLKRVMVFIISDNFLSPKHLQSKRNTREISRLLTRTFIVNFCLLQLLLKRLQREMNCHATWLTCVSYYFLFRNTGRVLECVLCFSTGVRSLHLIMYLICHNANSDTKDMGRFS